MIAEELDARQPVPEWAAGCTLEQVAHPYECHQVIRGHAIVGYVYDAGQGYAWAEGAYNIPIDD